LEVQEVGEAVKHVLAMKAHTWAMSAATRVRMLVTKERIWAKHQATQELTQELTQQVTQQVMLARRREKKACREERVAKWHLHFHNHTHNRIHSHGQRWEHRLGHR